MENSSPKKVISQEILKFKKLGKEIKISPKTYVSINKENSSINCVLARNNRAH